MKVKLFSLLAGIAMFATSYASCNDDNDESPFKNMDAVGEFIGSQNNLSGIISYVENLDKWFMEVRVPGSIDNVGCYSPVQMDKSFRAANTPVKFSGKVFLLDEAMKQQIPQLGGYEYYAIDLTELKRGL
jgi:hypothetical protein